MAGNRPIGLGSKKKEIAGYIKDYCLSNEAKEIINFSRVIGKKGFDLWSFKKLIFLDYYIKIHLQILENQGFEVDPYMEPTLTLMDFNDVRVIDPDRSANKNKLRNLELIIAVGFKGGEIFVNLN